MYFERQPLNEQMIFVPGNVEVLAIFCEHVVFSLKHEHGQA
jgi:hypothetical protein